MRRRPKLPSSYYYLLGTAFALLLFGIIMIFSASSVTAFAEAGDSFYYFKKQALYAFLGLICLFFFAKYDYHKLRKLSIPFTILMFVLLGIVLIPGIGRVVGGGRRWLSMGWLNLQPSEFAKLVIIIYAAGVLAKKQAKISNLSELLWPLVPIVGMVSFLVAVQPDLGTAFTISLTVFILMFISGAELKHLLGFGLTGLATVFIFIFSEEYRRRRFFAFFDPWGDPQKSGFHIIQSLIALGSGGIRGMGLGKSHQKFFYLPEAHTDFVFAIIGEELGLLGSLLVVALFSFLAYVGLRIAFRAKDFFGQILGTGIVSMILCQALINMGAVTGLIPVTGIPLPLISFGGSSLIFTLSGIGILLNIASQERPKIVSGVGDENSHKRRWNRRTRLSRTGTRRRVKVTI